PRGRPACFRFPNGSDGGISASVRPADNTIRHRHARTAGAWSAFFQGGGMVGTSKRFLVFARFLVLAALMQQTIGRAQQTPAFDLSQLQIPPGSALGSPPATGG